MNKWLQYAGLLIWFQSQGGGRGGGAFASLLLLFWSLLAQKVRLEQTAC